MIVPLPELNRFEFVALTRVNQICQDLGFHFKPAYIWMFLLSHEDSLQIHKKDFAWIHMLLPRNPVLFVL